MSTTRQALLSSVSHGTVVWTAGLARDLEQKGRNARRKRREKPYRFVMGAVSAGALALAVGVTGLTAAPQMALAQTRCFTDTDNNGAPGYAGYAFNGGSFTCGYKARAYNFNDQAVGRYSKANGGFNIFYGAGHDNTATGGYAFAGTTTIGNQTGYGRATGNTATGTHSFAGAKYAYNNTATGDQAFAGSNRTYGYARNNTATGASSFAGSQYGDAFDNTATGEHAHAGSHYGTASGNTATGQNAFAYSYHGTATNNTADGHNAFAGSQYGDATGNTATGAKSFAGGNILSYSGTAANFNTSVGYYAIANGDRNTAVGAYAQAIGFGNNTSLGFNITPRATITRRVAQTRLPRATETASAVYNYGTGNSAFGTKAKAIGDFNSASGSYSYAYGRYNSASGQRGPSRGQRQLGLRQLCQSL